MRQESTKAFNNVARVQNEPFPRLQSLHQYVNCRGTSWDLFSSGWNCPRAEQQWKDASCSVAKCDAGAAGRATTSANHHHERPTKRRCGRKSARVSNENSQSSHNVIFVILDDAIEFRFLKINQIGHSDWKINNVHLLVGIGEGSDSFGHNQRHLVGRCGVNRIDKDAPRSILLYRLAPTVWPSKDNRVGFQSAQTGWLDSINLRRNWLISID